MKRYLKRAVSVLTAVAIVFGSAMLIVGALVQRSFAENSSSELEPRYENGYAYTVDDGEARIWYADNTVTGDVVIPSKLGGYPVTAVCMSLPFIHESGITGAVIPSGVRTIKRNAFSYCRKLTSVTIPDTVTLIEAFAFEETALTDIYYEGSESDWAQIDIKNSSADGYNFEIEDAVIHYNTQIKKSSVSWEGDISVIFNSGEDDDLQPEESGNSDNGGVILALGVVAIAGAAIALFAVICYNRNNSKEDN